MDGGTARVGLDERIVSARVFIRLLANHRAIIAFEPRLPPAGVTAKEGPIATITDEHREVVPHLLRPILVVAEAQQQSIVVQQARV
jgi:hypothetical protein